MELTSRQKLEEIRKQMKSVGASAYIISSADPHQSEYVPEYWSGRSWVSGFTGSAGTVVITSSDAMLFTDPRYSLQAKHQLENTDFGIDVSSQGSISYIGWLAKKLKPGSVVACDYWCFSQNQIELFEKLLSANDIRLIDSGDLLENVWNDRPILPTTPIYDFPEKYAGKSRENKLKEIRAKMKQQKADYLILTALDEIAYLLNLRGTDVMCNPVFTAYLLIDTKSAILFISPVKVPDSLKKSLKRAKVDLRPYEELVSSIQKIDPKNKVWIDPVSLSARLRALIPTASIYNEASPVMLMKSVKNETEIGHIRKVMEKDGVALLKAFMWLEESLSRSHYPTEYEFTRKLIEYRLEQPLYKDESFDAIVGYQSNGAIIHYKPSKLESATIKAKGILLVDTGGQYLDGTTDITRTIALSRVSTTIKKQYTAVLMGHIALADAVFPAGTKGIQLDVLARQYLWKNSLNYSHGTGHGVGFFMNVHEPPQGFVTGLNQRGVTEIHAGMLTSNEPGYYEEGSHGIRIENLVLTVPHSKNQLDYLKFETVSLFPIDLNLIYAPDMTRQAIQWINEYHKEVYKRLSPYLTKAEKRWLKAKCGSL